MWRSVTVWKPNFVIIPMRGVFLENVCKYVHVCAWIIWLLYEPEIVEYIYCLESGNFLWLLLYTCCLTCGAAYLSSEPVLLQPIEDLLEDRSQILNTETDILHCDNESDILPVTDIKNPVYDWYILYLLIYML